MSEKIKIAVIGAGTWGGTHARIYREHPLAEVTAICDQNKGRAERLAAELGIDAVYDDYNEMLRHGGFDAAAIVTPDFAHADIAVAAANAKKHILIEKPLATTRDDAFRIVDAVEKNNVRAMVDFHNRWNPPFNAAYQSIRSGELGVVYTGSIRLNDCKWVATCMLPWAASSSILWFLGSHSVDTMRWLFGDEVSRVYSISRKGLLQSMGVDTEDCYYTTLEFKNGGVAHMENGWVTPDANPNVNDFKCNILGTKGMISIDATNHNLIQKYTDTSVSVPDILVTNTVFDRVNGFAYESIRSFVDCLYSGEPFKVSLTDALNTTLILLAVMESAAKRAPVYTGL